MPENKKPPSCQGWEVLFLYDVTVYADKLGDAAA